MDNKEIGSYMRIKLDGPLPSMGEFDPSVRRAPKRESDLSESDVKLALRNALRYIPEEYHAELAPEFYQELMERGKIYGYRFRPHGKLWGRPIDEYKGKCMAGKAIQVMVDNNLDFDVALYPYELVTYGETGQVCQNWMQYLLIKRYLEEMEEDQTLVVSSGHPVGLFHSCAEAPRVILTNGLLVGKYDDNDNWNRAAAMGVSNYGQFTAGGWFYIGSQGIVHGTFSTLLSVARSVLHHTNSEDMMKGALFVTAGLGGMSGAQGKSIEMCNGVGIIAEVDESKIALANALAGSRCARKHQKKHSSWRAAILPRASRCLLPTTEMLWICCNTPLTTTKRSIFLQTKPLAMLLSMAAIVRRGLPLRNVQKCWPRISRSS